MGHGKTYELADGTRVFTAKFVPDRLARLRSVPLPPDLARRHEERQRQAAETAAEREAMLADLRRRNDETRAAIDRERAGAQAALHARVEAEREATKGHDEAVARLAAEMRARRGGRRLG